jgi:hypothetical protein
MDITRNPDGTLTVTVPPDRHAETDADASPEDAPVRTRTLHPGEGGYVEALAEWELQQEPSGDAPVSTASGREQAMAVVHAVAEDPKGVAKAVRALADADAAAEALRHVLVGGVPSVTAFAAEVAAAEGGDALPAHKATKIIGEVLAEIET